jgi:hypothetical protein
MTAHLKLGRIVAAQSVKQRRVQNVALEALFGAAGGARRPRLFGSNQHVDAAHAVAELAQQLLQQTAGSVSADEPS